MSSIEVFIFSDFPSVSMATKKEKNDFVYDFHAFNMFPSNENAGGGFKDIFPYIHNPNTNTRYIIK